MRLIFVYRTLFLTMLTYVTTAFAQPAAIPPPPPQAGDPVLVLAAAQMSHAPVKGAPYCADAITESLQTLSDGNRITRKHTSRICRDNEGRTRQEVVNTTPRGIEMRRVFINDPVSHELWLLHPDRKVAVKLPSLDNLPQPPTAHTPDHKATPEQQARWRDYAQRVRAWARGDHSNAAPPPPPPPAAPGAEAVVIAPPETDRERKTIEVTRWMGSEGMAPQMLGVMNRLPPGKGQTQVLPTKTMEGVRAEGTLTTWTIDAATMGNEKPILITREEWRSPELKLPLMSRYNDPRSGEHRYQLSNLNRNVPASELFKVPGDYKQRER